MNRDYRYKIEHFNLIEIFKLGDALKCWTCNSNGTNSKFCEDPFDSSVIDSSKLIESLVKIQQYS